MTRILDEINPQNRWARTIWFDFTDLERGYIANNIQSNCFELVKHEEYKDLFDNCFYNGIFVKFT